MENSVKNTDYDLILIIISSRSYIYDKLISCYWIPLLSYIEMNKYRVKIYFAFGNNVPIEDLGIPKENTFIANVNESAIPGILIKTIDAMKFVDDNYKYKHILRANLGSFFILKMLLNTCKSLSDKDTYASHQGNNNLGEQFVGFAHGCGFWMSSDVVREIITNRKFINDVLPDDVAITTLLKGRTIQYVPRFDMTHNIIHNNELLVPIQRVYGPRGETGIKAFNATEIHHKEDLLRYITSLDHYHIRIKNGNRVIRDGEDASDLEETDIELMRCFTNKLYSYVKNYS